jgi:hypothetical protein
VKVKPHNLVMALLLVSALAVIVAGIGMPVSAGKATGTGSQQAPAGQETVNPAPSNAEGDQTEPVMNLSEADMEELQHEIDTSPVYPASNSSIRIPRGSLSLLPDLPYVPKERGQGKCSDCWVWSSTGAIEIEHTIKSGIRDRLSIQYLNDNFGSGPDGVDSGCCGGSVGKFVDWYSNKTANPDAMKLIPWSNTNASFAPGQSCNSPLFAGIPVSTSPAYRMSSLSAATVSTFGVDKSTAVNNIKSALNNNLPVLYAFNYDHTDMKTFQQWWRTEPETAIWDPAPFDGDGGGAAHVTLLVGYDDRTDPKNPYWLVVNSWGAPPNRPNGTFRLSMNMNYNAALNNPGSKTKSTPHQQQSFHIIDAGFMDTPETPVTGGTLPSSGTPATTHRAGSDMIPVFGALFLGGIFFIDKKNKN